MKQDPFDMNLFDVVVPDMGSGDAEATFVMWLVPEQASVIPGERIAELVSQGVVFTLEAPVEGILVRQISRPGDRANMGEVLGRIQTAH